MEPKLVKVIHFFITMSAFPLGDIIDAGANDGISAKMLAGIFETRTVLAIEPILSNVKAIRNLKVENIEILHGGLGQYNATTATYPRHLNLKRGSIRLQINRGTTGDYTYPIYSTDALFKNRKLAFAHWDVEGSEPEVIKGAVNTLWRDRPILTIETHKMHNAIPHRDAFNLLNSLNYTLHTIDEICGAFEDCRNHICIPTEYTLLNDRISRTTFVD